MNQSLPLLTPLRGIAALMVVLFHARLLLFPQWMESIAGHTQLIENGYLWVDLFFILSGLVLAHVYGEAFARSPRTISYGRFLWLRLTRVYPSIWRPCCCCWAGSSTRPTMRLASTPAPVQDVGVGRDASFRLALYPRRCQAACCCCRW